MRTLAPLVALLPACWGDNAYIVEGTVVERVSDTRVVVAHEEIPGFMPAMTMPFDVRDPAVLAGLEPGDRIYARLMVEEDGSWLARVRVTGHGAVPRPTVEVPVVAPVQPGEAMPALSVALDDGSAWTLGAGQGRPTVLSFVYTRCPIPEFCAATVARMQALQGALIEGEAPEAGPRILLVTLDPAFDTAAVLASFGATAGADPRVWHFGRVDEAVLPDLAMRAGLMMAPDGDQIAHSLRTLVLDGEGRLVERYDDNRWPLDRALEQLRTGGPPAPPGTNGTLTP